MSATAAAAASAADLRELDLQCHPFLRALQDSGGSGGGAQAIPSKAKSSSSSKASKAKDAALAASLAALYEMVAARGGLVLLPPAQACPASAANFEERWAQRHILLPLNSAAAEGDEDDATAAAAPSSFSARSRTESLIAAEDDAGSAAAAPPSVWTQPTPDGTARLVLQQGFIHDDVFAAANDDPAAAAAGVVVAGVPRAKILLEELHYDDDFRSFRVLCIDRPLCGPKGEPLPGTNGSTASASTAGAASSDKPLLGRAASAQLVGGRSRKGSRSHGGEVGALGSSPGASSSASLATSPSAGMAALPSPSLASAPIAPELRSLSEHRDLLTRVLGAEVASRLVFASPRLDFFFTDFALAWLGAVANQPDKAAEHIRATAARTLQEALQSVSVKKSAASSIISGGSGIGISGHASPSIILVGSPSSSLAGTSVPGITFSSSSAAAAAASAAALHSALQGLVASGAAAEAPPASRLLGMELQLALEAHLHSMLHAKIFTSTLTKAPAMRQAQEDYTTALNELTSDGLLPPTLFDVGLDARLVGLVDPRPAVEQLQCLQALHTPLERLACLQKVEALLLASMDQGNRRNRLAIRQQQQQQQHQLHQQQQQKQKQKQQLQQRQQQAAAAAAPASFESKQQDDIISADGDHSDAVVVPCSRQRSNSTLMRPSGAFGSDEASLFESTDSNHDGNSTNSPKHTAAGSPTSGPYPPLPPFVLKLMHAASAYPVLSENSSMANSNSSSSSSSSSRSPLARPASVTASASAASNGAPIVPSANGHGHGHGSTPSSSIAPSLRRAATTATTKALHVHAGSPPPPAAASFTPLPGSSSVRSAAAASVPSSSSSSSSSSSASSAHSSSSSSSSSQLSVSADDLLPLLVFVLLSARPAHVVANIAYMRSFGPSASSLLSAGTHSALQYRLANFEAAVSYVASGRLRTHAREARATMMARRAAQAQAQAQAQAAVARSSSRPANGVGVDRQRSMPSGGALTSRASSLHHRRGAAASVSAADGGMAVSSISVSSTRALHLLLTPQSGAAAATEVALRKKLFFSPNSPGNDNGNGNGVDHAADGGDVANTVEADGFSSGGVLDDDPALEAALASQSPEADDIPQSMSLTRRRSGYPDGGLSSSAAPPRPNHSSQQSSFGMPPALYGSDDEEEDEGAADEAGDDGDGDCAGATEDGRTGHDEADFAYLAGLLPPFATPPPAVVAADDEHDNGPDLFERAAEAAEARRRLRFGVAASASETGSTASTDTAAEDTAATSPSQRPSVVHGGGGVSSRGARSVLSKHKRANAGVEGSLFGDELDDDGGVVNLTDDESADSLPAFLLRQPSVCEGTTSGGGGGGGNKQLPAPMLPITPASPAVPTTPGPSPSPVSASGSPAGSASVSASTSAGTSSAHVRRASMTPVTPLNPAPLVPKQHQSPQGSAAAKISTAPAVVAVGVEVSPLSAVQPDYFASPTAAAPLPESTRAASPSTGVDASSTTAVVAAAALRVPTHFDDNVVSSPFVDPPAVPVFTPTAASSASGLASLVADVTAAAAVAVAAPAAVASPSLATGSPSLSSINGPLSRAASSAAGGGAAATAGGGGAGAHSRTQSQAFRLLDAKEAEFDPLGAVRAKKPPAAAK